MRKRGPIGRSVARSGRSVETSLSNVKAPKLRGQEEHIRSGGCDMNREMKFVRLCTTMTTKNMIVLVRFMAADVNVSEAGAMPGDARQEAYCKN